jgi:carbon storage regulator CsrA
MLVLTRRVGEKVVIGGKITIAVAAVQKDRVQLALDAPREVLILRGELAGLSPEPCRSSNGGDCGLTPTTEKCKAFTAAPDISSAS